MNETTPSKSYLQMCLHLDGKPNLYLRVPTIWDHLNMQWIAYVKTPKTLRLITGEGEDSLDLEQSFSEALKGFMENPKYSDEIYSMFQPMSYWEEMNDSE